MSEVNWSDDESVVRAAMPEPGSPTTMFGIPVATWDEAVAAAATRNRAFPWATARQYPEIQEFERTHRSELPELDVTEEEDREARLYVHGGAYLPFTEKHAMVSLKRNLSCRERQLREAHATIASLRAPLTGEAMQEMVRKCAEEVVWIGYADAEQKLTDFVEAITGEQLKCMRELRAERDALQKVNDGNYITMARLKSERADALAQVAAARAEGIGFSAHFQSQLDTLCQCGHRRGSHWLRAEGVCECASEGCLCAKFLLSEPKGASK